MQHVLYLSRQDEVTLVSSACLPALCGDLAVNRRTKYAHVSQQEREKAYVIGGRPKPNAHCHSFDRVHDSLKFDHLRDYFD
jgi:hypothetical protein